MYVILVKRQIYNKYSSLYEMKERINNPGERATKMNKTKII